MLNKVENSQFDIQYTANPFTFTISRKDDGDVLFTTKSDWINGIIFADQYVELSTQLPGTFFIFFFHL
jgi:hypothetical protein